MTLNNEYGEPASDYIRQVNEFCPSASALLERIRTAYGDRAAYLAGFALLCLKEQQARYQNKLTHADIRRFTFYEEMQADDEAIKLYIEAAAHLLTFADLSDTDHPESL